MNSFDDSFRITIHDQSEYAPIASDVQVVYGRRALGGQDWIRCCKEGEDIMPHQEKRAINSQRKGLNDGKISLIERGRMKPCYLNF
jgi:hypothetical protein